MSEAFEGVTRSRARRWARRVLLGFALLVVLCVLAVALLPWAVSTGWFRSRFETAASEALRRPVRVTGLHLDWSSELRIDELAIADLPSFPEGPLFSLRRLRLNLDPVDLLRGRLAVTLEIDGAQARLIRDATGVTNLERLLSDLAPREEVQKKAEPASKESTPVTIPFKDLCVRLRFTDIGLAVEDRSQGRSASIEGAVLTLDMPSLRDPITAEVSAALWVDGRELPPLRVDARVENVFTDQGRLNQNGLAAQIRGALPGVDLALEGDLATSRILGDVSLDLPRLAELARPFAPASLAATDLAGRLTVKAEITSNPTTGLGFDVTLSGEGLTVGGAVLDGRSAGPVGFALRQAGSLRNEQSELLLDTGELRIQERSRAAWRGSVRGLRGPTPELAVDLGPVSLDLAELRELAAPFLPQGWSVQLSGADGEPRPTLTIQSAGFAGPVASGSTRVSANGVALLVPRIRLDPGNGDLAGDDLDLRVGSLAATLEDFFPRDADAAVTLRVGRFDVAGPQPIAIRSLALPDVRLSLRGLERAPSAPLGVTGRVTVRQTLALGRLSVSSIAELARLQQSLEVECSASANGVEVRLGRARITAESVVVENPETGTPLLRLDPADGIPALKVEETGVRFVGTVGNGGALADLVDNASFAVERLNIAVPDATVAVAGNPLRAQGATLTLSGITTSLRNRFPHRIGLFASVGLNGLQIAGEQSLQLAGLDLERLHVRASDLRLSPESLFGVAGAFEISDALSLEKLKLAGLARLATVTQTLEVGGVLEPGPSARLELRAFGLASPAIRVEVPQGPLEIGCDVGARADKVTLRGLEAALVDVQGLETRMTVGDFLSARIGASAAGLGADSLETRGDLAVDLRRLARALPKALLPDLRLAGRTELTWDVAGRLPTSHEIASVRSDPASLLAGSGLPFLERLELQAALHGVGADRGTGSERVSVDGIFTERPLRLTLDRGGSAASVGGELAVEWIEALPGIGRFGDPLRGTVGFQAEQVAPGSVTLSESLSLEPIGFRQGLTVVVSGIDRLLAKGLDTPPSLWLTLLGGEARTSVRITQAPSGSLVAQDLALQGPLEIGAEARLARGEALEAKAWLRADGARVKLGEVVEVNGLIGDVELGKRYRLARAEGGETGSGPPPRLSESVLWPGGGPREPAGPTGPAAAADRFGRTSSLGFRSARLQAGPALLEVRDFQIDLDLAGGLPAVERVQAEMLGGSLIGSAELSRGKADEGGGFRAAARLAFTGLDAARLAPGGEGSSSGEGTEISGQLAVAVPVLTNAEDVIAGLELHAGLTHIGSRTLDRALYALDPTESNEAIVKQRRLVRLGSPRWVRVNARHGNLAVAGEVAVAGARVEMPRVERVRIAGLPGTAQLGEPLAKLGPVLAILRAASADTLLIEDTGAVRFIETNGGAFP